MEQKMSEEFRLNPITCSVKLNGDERTARISIDPEEEFAFEIKIGDEFNPQDIHLKLTGVSDVKELARQAKYLVDRHEA